MDVFPLNSWADILIDSKQLKLTSESKERCIEQIVWYGQKDGYTKTEINKTIKLLKKTIREYVVESESAAKRQAEGNPEQVFFYINEDEYNFSYERGESCPYHAQASK